MAGGASKICDILRTSKVGSSSSELPCASDSSLPCGDWAALPLDWARDTVLKAEREGVLAVS